MSLSLGSAASTRADALRPLPETWAEAKVGGESKRDGLIFGRKASNQALNVLDVHVGARVDLTHCRCKNIKNGSP